MDYDKDRNQCFIDVDGVVADFDARATEIMGCNPREWEAKNGTKNFWDKLYETPNFFLDLEPMKDAYVLYDAVKHLDPIFLTGCPRGYWAVPQKLKWRDKYFKDVPMICTESVNKKVHCRPGDVLVDDWHKHAHLWEAKGGHFVLHTSALDSIEKLKVLGVL